MNVEEYVTYKLCNAHVNVYPFPHFFVDHVFPGDFYDSLLDSLPDDKDYNQMSDHYPDRYFGPDNVPFGCDFMASERFMKTVLAPFTPWIRKKYPEGHINIASDIRLVRDKTGYRIGPHTDAPWKMVSLLFYLPNGYGWIDNGTSIYLPNDSGFRCEGGPHYEFEDFRKVYTAPFVRNSCFAFFKTDNSFHGVEQITDKFDRNVLLYNVYDNDKVPK